MDLLRENELIWGRLLPVDQPHLIERYNKALVAFGLRPTALKSFDIDRSGFSPQVADELGDPQYLDPHEINRRFIILTPAQQDLPVVHTAFSNTSQLLYEFFDKNRRAIDALLRKRGKELQPDLAGLDALVRSLRWEAKAAAPAAQP